MPVGDQHFGGAPRKEPVDDGVDVRRQPLLSRWVQIGPEVEGGRIALAGESFHVVNDEDADAVGGLRCVVFQRPRRRGHCIGSVRLAAGGYRDDEKQGAEEMVPGVGMIIHGAKMALGISTR